MALAFQRREFLGIFLYFRVELDDFVAVFLLDQVGWVIVGAVAGDLGAFDLFGELLMVHFTDFAFAFSVAP